MIALISIFASAEIAGLIVDGRVDVDGTWLTRVASFEDKKRLNYCVEVGTQGK